MAQYNIGPKIGIEGEKEFRAQISRINKEYSAMESYTKAVNTAMAQQGKSQDLLAAKSNSLRQQINLQQQRFEELYKALNKARENFDANSQEVLRFEGAILDVKNTTAALQRELDATDDELRRMADGIEDAGDAAEDADDKVLSFGDMLKAGIASGAILDGLKRAGELIVKVGSQSIEAAAEVKAANAQFSQTFGNLEGTATKALRSISDETGIAVTRLQGGYTALYAFVKSVGGDSDTALNIAQRALTAAADSAAYYDRTVEDATETLQSFLKGNYENDAALGIAATETTRNAKANELYAKSFNELSESQKVDTLLAMVEAGNAASGALGQAAREADSWANVTGELSEAWRQFLASLGGPVMEGLIPTIQGITQGLQNMTTKASWQKLRTGVEGFQKGIAAADESLESSNREIEATAGLAEQYVRRLKEIEEAGLDTAESQREYKQVVELLNTLMPELNLQIDANTGRINKNSDALLGNIKSLTDQARAQAQQSYYKKILDASAQAYEDLYEAEAREKVLLAERQILLDRGAQAHENLSYAQAGTTAAMEEFNASLSEDDKRLAAVNLELEALDGEIRNAEASLASAEQKIDAASEAFGDYGDASEEAKAATEAQTEAQQKLADAYDAAMAEAMTSIDTQVGLFDELAEKSDWSAEKIIENWEKQREAFVNYEDNLKKAVDMGLDEALVQQLADGSQESMLILDELVNGTELSVDKINTAFSKRMTAKQSLATTLAEMKTATSDAMSNIATTAKSGGGNIVDGSIRGIKANQQRFFNAMADLAAGGKKAWNEEWVINSPSGWMEDASDYIVDGGVLQIERRTPDMAKAMRSMAQAGQSAYLREQLDYAAQYPSMVAGSPGYGGAVTNSSTRNVAYGGITLNVYTQPGQDPQEFGEAVLDVLTSRLGKESAAFE